MKIVCTHCGGPITVGVEQAGRMIPCPFCSASVLVPIDHLKDVVAGVKPASPSETASRQPLSLRKNVSVSGLPHCPACYSVMDEGVVVCVKCGFDFRTGRRYDTKFRRRMQWGVPVFAVLALLGAAAAVWWYWPRGVVPQKIVETVTKTVTLEKPVVERVTVIELADRLNNVVSSNLSLTAPSAQEGHDAELRLTNGVIVRGTFCSVRGQSVLIESGGVTNKYRLRALDAYTRLAFDEKFRWTWLTGEALVMARDDLVRQGKALPKPAIDSMDSLTNALALADPVACKMCGGMYLRGIEYPKDVGYAFLFTRLAAMQGLPEAQYDLGLFHLAGIAVAQNLNEGIHWISQAADQQFRPAQDYLLARKQNEESASRVCRQCMGVGRIACTKCKGFGYCESGSTEVTCEHCGGTGKFKKRLASYKSTTVPCAFCKGTGKAPATSRVPCDLCGQTGLIDCPRCRAAGGGPSAKGTNWMESVSDWFIDLIQR